MIKRIILWLINGIRRLCGFLKKHPREVIAVAGVLGTAGAGAGAVKAKKAKKINKQAQEIQQAAIEKHDKAYSETEQVLSELGKVEKEVIDSFEHFADTIERIHGRPQFKSSIFSKVKLPNYEPEEIKKLSIDLQMAIVAAGGVGVGTLAGLAAFGAGAIVAGPAVAGAGLILCVKGFGLKKKAANNKRQAKQMEKSVDEIIAFYTELQKTADSFRISMIAVYQRYQELLKCVEETLTTKTNWKQFSKEEKNNVQTTVMLVTLLCEMIKTKIVVKQEKEDKLETINSAELEKLQKKAQKALDTAA